MGHFDALEIVALQTGVLGDTRKHSGSDLDGIVKSPNIGSALRMLEDYVGALLRFDCVADA